MMFLLEYLLLKSQDHQIVINHTLEEMSVSVMLIQPKLLMSMVKFVSEAETLVQGSILRVILQGLPHGRLHQEVVREVIFIE